MEVNEYLKEKLNEDQLKAIEGVELSGEIYQEEMVPVRRINEVTAEKKTLETQLKSTEKTLSELKADQELSDTLKAKITDLEAEKTEIENNHKDELEKLQLNNKIDLAINQMNPKNFKSVSILFDRTGIKLDGEELLGFKGQAEKIKEENPFLFSDEKSKKIDTDNGTGTKTPAKNPFEIGSISLSEQVKLRKDNPSLAEKLQREAEAKRGY